MRPPTTCSFFGFPSELPECGSFPCARRMRATAFRGPGVCCARCAWEVEAASLLGVTSSFVRRLRAESRSLERLFSATVLAVNGLP